MVPKNSRSRRNFLLALSSFAAGCEAVSLAMPSVGRAGASPRPDPAGAPGQAFLQVTLYEQMVKKDARLFFAAIDRYYTPLLLKAPGLISYQRFRHFDLPKVLDLQLWENQKTALGFYDSEAAQKAWKLALSKVPSSILNGLSPAYHQETHSDAHRHFILQKSLKA